MTRISSLCLALVLVLLAAPSRAETPRRVLDLDGTWDFATDPDRVGEAERWYLAETPLPSMPREGYSPAADGTIRVPGIWDNQGYGTATDKVRHNFVGLGWYRRSVSIPAEWGKGWRLFLRIGGVHRSAKVWVEGRLLGEHVGYLSAFEYDVTSLVRPGDTAAVVIQVDSRQRWDVDTLFGASDLADYMDVAWGGIWGHVSLEARALVWLDDLFLQPRVSPPGVRATAAIRGAVDSEAPGEVADAARLEVFDASGRRVAASAVSRTREWAPGSPLELEAAIPEARLWSPDTPALYTARLALLRDGAPLDAVESRFGLREIRISGHRILLNGAPLFLRGYGDDHIYPEEMARPADKELHLRRLRTIRSYGFNHVRHHSTILSPEYYDACDEVGILATAEFPIVYSPFLPGGERWRQNVPEGTDPELAADTYRREWAAAVTRYRNHPSILAWVMGNELWDGVPLREDFARIARSLDPTRPFADSDGVTDMWGRILDPKSDRDTLDIYFLMFDVGTNPLDNPGKFRTPEPIKPIVSHETGNYVTFSRPDLAARFRHNIKPFWLAAGLAKIEALGLLAEAEAWAERSERLYLLCHKHNLEALRKNPFISGYHWWLFQDYWTSSNGLVDHYFRPKAISPEEVLRTNDAVVVLADGLELTYRGAGSLEARLLVSSFAPRALADARLEWSVELGGDRIAGGERTLPSVESGGVTSVAEVRAALPDVPEPRGLVVRARLAAGSRVYANEWTARVFPAAAERLQSKLPVHADATMRARRPALDLRAIPDSGDLPAEAVYVVAFLDTRVLAAAERGARVVLLDETRGVIPSRRITYRTSWWKAGDHPDRNHCGTFVYDHPATRAMAPDGWCDAGWFHLLEGASKYVLEGAPARPRVIVRALPSLALVEDAAVLFEVGIGKGSLLVSGLHHDRARGRPEDEWLVARLIEHAAASPPPEAAWPASFVRAAEPPPPGPHLTGFRRVVRNEGEEGVWHSYREDNVKFLISRQTAVGNLLEWETVPAPSEEALRGLEGGATFVFAGGLGYESEPRTEGFALLVGGTEVLRFDLASKDAEWRSADGGVALRFLPRRHLPQDALGLFYVTISRKLLEPGEPVRLGVRSLGSGSRRWFGNNEYVERQRR